MTGQPRCCSLPLEWSPAVHLSSSPAVLVAMQGHGEVGDFCRNRRRWHRAQRGDSAVRREHAVGYAVKPAGQDRLTQRARRSPLPCGFALTDALSSHQHVGPLLATAAGLERVEASTVEACCGSGGAALRWGYMAVASGLHETVVVAGVEQMTHQENQAVTKGLATASDWEKEGAHGATFVSLNGTLMSMYKSKYGIDHEAFGAFPNNAHNNASSSEHAVLKKRLSQSDYRNSPIITEPVRLLDACPTCDGAAAVVLTASRDSAAVRRAGASSAVVRLAGSGASSDILCVHDRPDPLHLAAVSWSTEQALRHAGLVNVICIRFLSCYLLVLYRW